MRRRRSRSSCPVARRGDNELQFATSSGPWLVCIELIHFLHSHSVEDHCAGVRVDTRRCRQRADWWLLDLSRLTVLTPCLVPSCLLRKHLELQCGRGHWTVPHREEANCDHSKRCRVSNHLRGISYPSMASRQSSHHAHSKWTTHPPGER